MSTKWRLSRKAGKSGMVKFKADRKEWRRERWKPLAAVWALVIAAGVIAFWSSGRVRDVGLLMTGALYVGALSLMDLVPVGVENWRIGAEGERRTAKMLHRLSKHGWSVTHDLHFDGQSGNVDHVAVGPAGIFLLDSKYWSGRIELVGDKLHVTRRWGQSFSKKVPAKMRGASADLKDRLQQLAADGLPGLQQLAERGCWVQGVIVVWGDFPQQVADGDRVTVVHGKLLDQWLRTQPASKATLDPDKVIHALESIDSTGSKDLTPSCA